MHAGNQVGLLGYDPKVSLQEGVRRTTEWYRANLHLQSTNQMAKS